ncbi:uncharacterized protein LOC123682343 [Harmonia axyridis]|uniref:uncharacterized protein LOC123682343 n=1 Tax=Harmonia axyridis TaxID=115357 RepID=UPI001E27768D|nr:uncharacterized protein LOC123682343 [Harmonia axyridis]
MEHDTYCHECKREYSGVSNLRRHIKKFHPEIPPPYQEKKDYPFTCEECGKNFSYMRNFKSHRKSHLPPDQVVEYNKAKIKKRCPICEYSDWDRRGLFHHFREEHEIVILPEHKDFADFDSFLEWKKLYENENKSLFIKRHEASTAKYESTMIYRCHRSGYYQPRGKNIRRLKTQGSCKIDGYCPATIKAMKHKNGSVKVMLFATHVGHNEDLPPLTVSKQEKREIKANGKLKSIRLRHKTSLTLQKDLIVKTNQGWLFPSCKSGEVYCITAKDLECQCEINCSECKVCIHRYSCTCSDSTKKGNMCKHVHLLCQPHKTEEEMLQQEQLQQEELQELKSDQITEHYEQLQHEQLQHEQLQNEQLQHEQLQHDQLHTEDLQHDQLQHEHLQHEQLQHEHLQHEHLQHDQLHHETLQAQHHSGHSDDELIIYEGLHPDDDTDMQDLADHHQHIQNMLEDRKQSILNKLNDVLQRCNNENLLREIEMYVIQLDARVECGVLAVPPLVPLPNTPVAVAVATPLLEISSPKRQKAVLTELKQSKPIIRFQANDLFRHL